MKFRELPNGARFIRRPSENKGSAEYGASICEMFHKLNQNHGHCLRATDNCMSDCDKRLHTMPDEEEVMQIV